MDTAPLQTLRTKMVGHLPFSLRALFQAELEFSHLVLLRGVKIILRGEGEVGRFEQVTPCERKECKLEERKREVERKRASVFFALWRWQRDKKDRKHFSER